MAVEHGRHRRKTLLLASASLGACSTWKPPAISYDDTPWQAVLQLDGRAANGRASRRRGQGGPVAALRDVSAQWGEP